jgi:hypothetical protein
MKRTTRKASAGHTFVTVEIPTKHLAIARAIVAVMTAEFPKERPYTLAEAVSSALDEGLIANEKFWLGTRSLDHSVRSWESEDDYPETTPQMLALVRAVSGKAAA